MVSTIRTPALRTVTAPAGSMTRMWMEHVQHRHGTARGRAVGLFKLGVAVDHVQPAQPLDCQIGEQCLSISIVRSRFKRRACDGISCKRDGCTCVCIRLPGGFPLAIVGLVDLELIESCCWLAISRGREIRPVFGGAPVEERDQGANRADPSGRGRKVALPVGCMAESKDALRKPFCHVEPFTSRVPYNPPPNTDFWLHEF